VSVEGKEWVCGMPVREEEMEQEKGGGGGEGVWGWGTGEGGLRIIRTGSRDIS
jgi:hypothetical protein